MLEHVDLQRFRGQKVGVLLGGDSSEREISLKTGNAFVSALQSRGYDVSGYDMPADLERLIAERPAAVIIGLHGGKGENGSIQGLLSVLGIPYTGSGVLASALAMDKARSKDLLREHQVPVAQGVFVSARELNLERIAEFQRFVPTPNVVKLNDAGSSVGVFCCHTESEFIEAMQKLIPEVGDEPTAGILIEKFVDGPEYSVGFFDGEFLGAIEIQAQSGFYDYEAKYNVNTTKYLPVNDAEMAAQLESIGRAAFRVIGCQGVARVDIMGRPGQFVVLELNTIPGMTATSLIPKMAASRGMEFEVFTEYLLASAHL